MASHPKPGAIFTFGPFRLDAPAGVVTRDGVKLPLSARAFEVLHMLARREGGTVTRDELLAEVWRGVTVEENNLTVQVSALRRALGDAPGDTPVIITVPNQGYRLAGPVTCNAAPPADAIGVATKTAPRRPMPKTWLAAACLITLLVVVATIWQRTAHRGASPPPPEQATVFAPPRLSIVVLPFRNLADDHQDDPLADAVSDDLTTELAHLPASTVTSRETADSYKGRAIPTCQIARALNVRYVLEGSLRTVGDKISVNAQLIEGGGGAHLWAERFEVSRVPVDQTQPAIVYRIASGLRTVMIADEAKRSLAERHGNPDAMDLYLRARAIWGREESRPSMAQAIPLLEQAIRLQPDFVPALAELGAELSVDAKGEGPAATAGRLAEGHRAVDTALGLTRHDPMVLAAQGMLLVNDGKMEAAGASFDAALAIDPANRVALMGGFLAAKCLARWQSAYDRILRLQQIDPEGPGAPFRDELLGEMSLLLGHPAEAVTQIERGDASWPAPSPNVPAWDALGSDRLFLAAALALSGDTAKARAMLQADAAVFPHRSLFRFGEYMTRDAQNDPAMIRVFAALRQAGVPDFNDEYEDDGIAAPTTPQPHGDLDATPTAIPGIPTIATPALLKLLQVSPAPVLIDMGSGVARPPGAIDGGFDPLSRVSTGAWLQANASRLGHRQPVIVFGDGASGWRAYNGILQLRQAGVSGLMWYRGGEEAWAKAKLPATDTRD